MEILGIIGGLIVLGVLYALFVEGINKGGEAISKQMNKEKAVDLTPEEEVFIKKNGLKFESKNQWWLWVEDSEGNLCCIDYKKKDWTLKRVFTNRDTQKQKTSN